MILNDRFPDKTVSSGNLSYDDMNSVYLRIFTKLLPVKSADKDFKI